MKDKKEKRSIKDFVPALLVSLAASFMIMVFAPIEIYYSNQDQFWFEIKQLIPVVICLFMIFLVVSLVVLGVLFLINQKAYNVGIILYLIAFLSTYIQGNFLVKNLPGLDGTQPVWKDYISEDIKTIIVWGGSFNNSYCICSKIQVSKAQKCNKYSISMYFPYDSCYAGYGCINN